MQKTGQIERTVDRDFAEESAKFKAYEREALALQKDSKTFLDAMRTLAGTQVKVSESIDVFYNAGDRMSDGAMAASAYRRSVDELDSLASSQMVIRSEPAGKMVSYFPAINGLIDKRNKKLLDYDAARSKLRKLEGKPDNDPTKLPRAEKEYEEAKAIFDVLNEQLITELPQFLDLRVPFFDPSFEAMIRLQSKFAEEGYEKLGGVQRYFPDNVRDDYAAGQLDSQVENVLQEMKDLSICSASG
ncbi:hypothetical protein BS47DRAFT_1373979 [Hydnum rufescens UP504]|uniref:BAR domain-containing protein n=1 Tax=Hydnum rufescens UP504 TaxID=1448309 RepID=A0A9P6DMM9_9AGAM|nr:hypothetical protein BS47DRAFT_1373979 [Hydnum rufescens UP504]